MKSSKPFYVWWFFPITGLEITGSDYKFLLDDATLVSKTFVEDCLPIYASTMGFSPSYAQSMLLNDRVDSLVAIKRKNIGSLKEEARLAEERFEEILAALVVYSLENRGFMSAYCSTDSLTVKHFGTVGLRDTAPLGVVNSEIRSNIMYHRKDDSLSIRELDYALATSNVSDIVGIILFPSLSTSQRKNRRSFKKIEWVHSSIRRVFILVAKRITVALNTHSTSEIVAASITCFEILLSSTGVKDDDVRGRLDVLVGFKKDQIETLYNARNDWIHRGIKCGDMLDRTAIWYVILAMQAFADLVFRVSETVTHQELLQWLDYHQFIRKKNNELPGRLKGLADSLGMFEPFQIAEKIRLSHL